MPNATVRANAQAMPIDRRAALGSLVAAAGALLASPKLAKAAEASADARIFELVADGTYWWSQISPVSDRAEDPEANPGAEEELQAVFDRYNAAFEEMLAIVPQTPAGARAKLKWVKKDCEGISLPDDHVALLVESFLASPLLASDRGLS